MQIPRMSLSNANDLTHVAQGRGSSVLSSIHRGEITLAIQERPWIPAVQDYLRRTGRFTNIDSPCEADIDWRGLSSILEANGLPSEPGRDRLARDLASLVRSLCDLDGADAAQLRLEYIPGDACRLFHPDNNRMRLVCTYLGPTTQWLPNSSVERSAIGRGSNDAICGDWSSLRSLRPFWVGLMKGHAFPGNAGNGLVHRSPPQRPGQFRVFLALDPL
jgi:hypothetical protein